MSRVVAAAVLERRWGSVSRKAIALVLADHADADEWSTVIGQQRTAAESEVSERTVRSILADFQSEGLITRSRRHRKDGTRTSDRITLIKAAIESLPEAVAGSDDNRQPEALAGGETRLPATGRGDYRQSCCRARTVRGTVSRTASCSGGRRGASSDPVGETLGRTPASDVHRDGAAVVGGSGPGVHPGRRHSD